MGDDPLIRPGENVWVETDVNRCGWAIDGAAYYRAIREFNESAKKKAKQKKVIKSSLTSHRN